MIQDLQLVNDTSDQQLNRLTNNQIDLDQQALENDTHETLTLSNLQPSLAAIDGVSGMASNADVHLPQNLMSLPPRANNPSFQTFTTNNGSVANSLTTHQSSPFSVQRTSSMNNENNTSNNNNNANFSNFSHLNQQHNSD